MQRSFTIPSKAGLLVALALLLNPAPIFAAEAHALRNQRPRDLAIAYEATYNLAYRNESATQDPLVRGRRARRLAADAIASVVAGNARIAQTGRTPADEAASKAAAAALNAGSQNCRVLFAYRDAYWAACDALGGESAARPDQATEIAAFAVARAVSQQVAANESAGGGADNELRPAKSNVAEQAARDQYPAAYDAAYKAAFRMMGSNSITHEFDECMAAYSAAQSQLIHDHVECSQRMVEDLAIKAIFDAAHDWTSSRRHIPR